MLQQAERFQTDIKQYREAIDKITDVGAKLEAEKLLNNLIFEVKGLDMSFTEMVYQKQLPSQGTEMRERISEIRKKLDSQIKLNG
jgi:2-keto-4-pentenoate hydratase